MTVLKCKICGGDIQVVDATYGTCDSCGCNVTLPKVNDEQILGLFNRGNMLRMRGEFDKAAALFERVIEQDATNAEAHWCLFLCRYGIEYVEDPKTGERVPTCHRASYNSLLNDVDYLAAIENSDYHTANIYTAEAKKIAEIQKAIIAVSKQETPYDIFICYKETAASGSRTKESVIAQDIYYELTNAGYKVFFSRITLESKLGVQYEPYIFAALNSAKVMLVIGTCKENFDAVWVRNEWSRFLSIMKNDRSRLLIPCYKNMDPYDIPDELAILQSQDMSKIGFMQDITRGIKKVLDKNETVSAAQAQVQAGGATGLSSDKRIQNANTFLKLNDYDKAQNIFKQVTEEYPEDHRGWWGLILCKTENFTSKNLRERENLRKWLGYIKQLSTPEIYAEYEKAFCAYIKNTVDIDAMAEKDKAAVNDVINKLTENIALLKSRRSQAESERDNLSAKFEREIKQKRRKRNRPVVMFITVIAIFAISFIISGDWVNAMLFVPVGLGMWGLLALMSHAKKDDENSELIACIESEDALSKEIKDIDNTIAQTQEKIQSCKQYLTLEKEKILNLHFAMTCDEVGIEQEIDESIVNIRNVALGLGVSNEQTQAEVAPSPSASSKKINRKKLFIEKMKNVSVPYNIYVGKKIPQDKLDNALSVIPTVVNEDVLVLIDETAFGSAKDATLITTWGLRHRMVERHNFSWKDLKGGFNLEKGFQKINLIFTDSFDYKIAIHNPVSNISLDTLRSILNLGVEIFADEK